MTPSHFWKLPITRFDSPGQRSKTTFGTSNHIDNARSSTTAMARLAFVVAISLMLHLTGTRAMLPNGMIGMNVAAIAARDSYRDDSSDSDISTETDPEHHDPPPAQHRRMTAAQRDHVRNLPVGARLPPPMERIARRAMNVAPLTIAAQHEHYTDVSGTLHLPRIDDDDMIAGDAENGPVYLAFQVDQDSDEPPELVTDSDSDNPIHHDPNLIEHENADDPIHEAGAPFQNGVEQMLDSPNGNGQMLDSPEVAYYHVETSDSEGAASF